LIIDYPFDVAQSLPHSTSSGQALTGVEGTGLEFGGATLRLRSGQVATLRHRLELIVASPEFGIQECLHDVYMGNPG